MHVILHAQFAFPGTGAFLQRHKSPDIGGSLWMLCFHLPSLLQGGECRKSTGRHADAGVILSFPLRGEWTKKTRKFILQPKHCNMVTCGIASCWSTRLIQGSYSCVLQYCVYQSQLNLTALPVKGNHFKDLLATRLWPRYLCVVILASFIKLFWSCHDAALLLASAESIKK